MVVVGDLVADVVVRLPGPVRPGTDTGAAISTSGGGSAANTAAWLASLGLDVLLVARVGDDLPGRSLAAELAAAGVATALAVDPDRPTGALVSLVAPDGERSMLVDRGANDALRPADVPDLAGADLLHLSGYALLHEGCRDAGLAALAAAHAAGVPVSVDPSSAGPLRDAGPAEFLRWTAGCALATPNDAEAEVLTGSADPAAAAHELGRHYRSVVVTCGADGAVAYAGGRLHWTRAPRAEVVDTTGAGDAYTAGLLAARLGGADWPEAMDAGAALAARAVAAVGARPR
ncbi:sugar/nucleoside kinase (ribokinase family) [Motilibacter rhizosphaerae]|uniref:Sugar/nucleoside kinase (Ribokinase family) n=1 Tax=Motilibacter rhizosphaerae TaxID=598652 RepID=A0A4Q7NQS1_9ACTN|nr:sugar/nucleoside kinase (ribokinase family) [Motilibacter rhizosphaerae]